MPKTVDEQLGHTRRTAWRLGERIKARQNELDARLAKDPDYRDDVQAIVEDQASLRSLRRRECELLGMDGSQEMMDLEGEVAE